MGLCHVQCFQFLFPHVEQVQFGLHGEIAAKVVVLHVFLTDRTVVTSHIHSVQVGIDLSAQLTPFLFGVDAVVADTQLTQEIVDFFFLGFPLSVDVFDLFFLASQFIFQSLV